MAKISAVDSDSGVESSKGNTPVDTQSSQKMIENTAQPDNEDDMDFEDESILERLVGLTEMFPDSVQSASSSIYSTTKSVLKGSFHNLKSVAFFASTVSIVLLGPPWIMIQNIQIEDMLKQDRNKLVLGPGIGMSGPPMPGI